MLCCWHLPQLEGIVLFRDQLQRIRSEEHELHSYIEGKALGETIPKCTMNGYKWVTYGCYKRKPLWLWWIWMGYYWFVISLFWYDWVTWVCLNLGYPQWQLLRGEWRSTTGFLWASLKTKPHFFAVADDLIPPPSLVCLYCTWAQELSASDQQAGKIRSCCVNDPMPPMQ